MAESTPTPDAKPTNKLRWLLGWIVLPGSLIAALFLTGVHVGARHPDMGLSRLLLKVFHAKAGVAEPPVSHDEGPRPGAKPGAAFHYSVSLDHEQLQTIASKTLTTSVDDLGCEVVCRAWAKSRDIIAIYSVDTCELGRTVNALPTLLMCSGKLEASEAPAKPEAPSEAPAKPAND
jgi:hypothetical protein